MVWDGRLLQEQDRWWFDLDDADITQLGQAVQQSIASDIPLEKQTHNEFNLCRFDQRFVDLRDDVSHGRGFALIRGLSRTNWSDAELIRAYWLLGSWFGHPVSQNAQADLLGHVIDLRLADTSTARQYQTNAAQPFHSDSCDIVGLLCLRRAKTGGESSIASSAYIHNHLLAKNPASLETLYDEFLCDRYGEIPAGKKAYYPIHVFNNVSGTLVCCGMDPDIRLAPRLEGVDELSQTQVSALDAFQETAKISALNMMLERGDMQFVNNLTVVHARDTFEDHADLNHRRYLVRLWLSSPTGRKLPDFLSERWGDISQGRVRGGILVPGAVPAVNLLPANQ